MTIFSCPARNSHAINRRSEPSRLKLLMMTGTWRWANIRSGGSSGAAAFVAALRCAGEKRAASLFIGTRPWIDRSIAVIKSPGCHGARGKLVHDDALHRVDGRFPRRLADHATRVLQSRLPAGADAGRAEVDVLPVVLARERRREQAHHVHGGVAAPAIE